MALMYSKDIKAKYAVKVRVACTAARTSGESIALVLPSATPAVETALLRAVVSAVHGVCMESFVCVFAAHNTQPLPLPIAVASRFSPTCPRAHKGTKKRW